eukprot:3923925-Prymnesium_polylepis.1
MAPLSLMWRYGRLSSLEHLEEKQADVGGGLGDEEGGEERAVAEKERHEPEDDEEVDDREAHPLHDVALLLMPHLGAGAAGTHSVVAGGAGLSVSTAGKSSVCAQRKLHSHGREGPLALQSSSRLRCRGAPFALLLGAASGFERGTCAPTSCARIATSSCVVVCWTSVSNKAIRLVAPKPVKKAFECEERVEPSI